MKNNSDIIDNIIALSTPAGKGGIAVIRISGNFYINKIKNFFLIKKSRYAYYRTIYDEKKNIIDNCIIIYYESPKSFTGDNIIEIHCHSNIYIIDNIINIMKKKFSLRHAYPGEFSKRAFLNNKIDLIQAESIIDLINAKNTSAALAAANSLSGNFSIIINNIINELLNIRSIIESQIDFSEDNNLNENIDIIYDHYNKIFHYINNIIKKNKKNYLLNEDFKIVIFGKSNVGKSSLLNLLSNKSSAIVSKEIGTTRDIIKEIIEIGGITIHLYDTAGINKYAISPIEKEGIRRSENIIKKNNMILLVKEWNNNIDTLLNKYKIIKSNNTIIINNKIDLSNISYEKDITYYKNIKLINFSVKKKIGLNILLEEIKKNVSKNIDEYSNTFLFRKRHIEEITLANKHIKKSFNMINNNKSMLECIAEEIRLAQKILNNITGQEQSYEENLLEKIFSDFCIGK